MSRRALAPLLLALAACTDSPYMRVRVADDAAPLRVLVVDEAGAPVPSDRELLADAEVVCEGCALAPVREKAGGYWISLEPNAHDKLPQLTIRAPGHATVKLQADELPGLTQGGTLAWLVVLRRIDR